MAVNNKTKGKPPPKVKDPSGIIKDPERKQPGSRRLYHAKHDWEEIENIYVYGDMSYAELAKAVGCSRSTLNTHASRGKWVEKREKARAELRARVNENVLERQTADGVRMIQNIQNITERITMMLADVFADEKQFRRHLVQKQSGFTSETVEKTFSKADLRSFRDAMIGLEKLTNVTRDVYGLPKADAAPADGEAITGVILLPEREDAGAGAVQAPDQAWEFLKGEEYGSSGGAGPGAGPGADAAEAPATGEPDAEGQGGGA